MRSWCEQTFCMEPLRSASALMAATSIFASRSCRVSVHPGPDEKTDGPLKRYTESEQEERQDTGETNRDEEEKITGPT